MDCAERKRLVAEHLRVIGEWKKTFDDAYAWQRALRAERAVLKHCEKHRCEAQAQAGIMPLEVPPAAGT